MTMVYCAPLEPNVSAVAPVAPPLSVISTSAKPPTGTAPNALLVGVMEGWACAIPAAASINNDAMVARRDLIIVRVFDIFFTLRKTLLTIEFRQYHQAIAPVRLLEHFLPERRASASVFVAKSCFPPRALSHRDFLRSQLARIRQAFAMPQGIAHVQPHPQLVKKNLLCA